MSVSDSQKAAAVRWDKENMTNIACRVTKTKAMQFRLACQKNDTNPNAVLLAYINEYIEKAKAQE